MMPMLSAKPGELCPFCKKHKLMLSDFVMVDGHPEKIAWNCIKCPDEVVCGFAKDRITKVEVVGEPIQAQ